MNIQFAPNTLYYGDCLDIMADFPDGCVDLICLDPPFNSNAKYSTIFRNSGQTAFALAAADPFKFQDWSISLIDGLAANPKKVGDEGIDGFGMFYHKPDNLDTKAIIVQVTASAGSQKAKFDKLQSDVRSHNAAMGILITRDAQTARSGWRVNLPPIAFGETTFAPMQCFSIEDYYRAGERTETLLQLPPLANPWTGKPIQKLLFNE